MAHLARFCTGLLAAIGPLILSLSSAPGLRAAEIVDLNENILHGLIAEGGLITFGVNGTVTLSRTLNITKDTILDGSGHTVTLSGMDAVRVLYVNTNVTLTLSNLTIASGRSDTGGGMYNAGGNVEITGCRFINNQARGTNGTSDSYLTSAGGCGAGGAIFNAGDLWVTNSELSTNAAFGGSGAVMGTPGGRGGGAEGGAVYNVGRVWIAGTSFITNRAFAGNGGDATSAADPTNMIRGGTGGAGGYGRGGAVSSLGLVEISSSSFDDNVANAGRGGTGAGDEFARGGAGGDGEAGALYNSGTLALTNCCFRSNRAVGGDSGYGYFSPRGGSARGGSIYNGGLMTANSNCLFTLNYTRAAGSSAFKGGLDGQAFGGGIFNTGTLWMASAVLVSNTAYDGEAAGGGIYSAGGYLGLTSSVFVGNRSLSGTAGGRYYGGPGFDSFGGAAFNAASASFSNCSFVSNSVLGGWPYLTGWPFSGVAPSGKGYGGGLASSGSLELAGCSFVANSASGAPGVAGVSDSTAAGGNAAGGALAVSGGTVKVLNTTLSGCSAFGAPGGSADTNRFNYIDGGPGGSAFGGGIFVTNASVAMTNCTVAGNTVTPGPGGPGGPQGHTGAPGTASWGGIALETNVLLSLQNTIVTGNAAGDVSGPFSGSRNLIAVDARLGALTTNGQGTTYLPLMPDSPAIDAALPVAGIDIDQRGVARPFGSAPDIGAYEWNGTDFYRDFVLISLTLENGASHLKGGGPVNQTFRIRVSGDLFNWNDVAFQSSGPMGLFEYSEPFSLSEPRRFYQIVAP